MSKNEFRMSMGVLDNEHSEFLLDSIFRLIDNDCFGQVIVWLGEFLTVFQLLPFTFTWIGPGKGDLFVPDFGPLIIGFYYYKGNYDHDLRHCGII